VDLDRLEDIQEDETTWSVSRLQTIMRCGHRYALKYIDHVPDAPTPPLAFGTALHRTIELLHLTNQWDDGFIQRTWSDYWYEAQETIDWDLTSYRKSTYDNKGPKILDTYISKHKDDQWYGLEIDFKVSLFDGLPVFRGKIDKVQRLTEHPDIPSQFVGRLGIIDYKSSKNTPDRLLLSVDPQLIIYHQAFKVLTGQDAVVGLHHLPTDTIYFKEVSSDDFDNVVLDMLRRGIKRVESKEYERTISWDCKFCPYFKSCLEDLSEPVQTS
jgi:ATP-dependent helicase/DNAse subunit B